jgi:hypothetical protein
MSKNIGLESDSVRKKLVTKIHQYIPFSWKEFPLKEHHLVKEIKQEHYSISPDINGRPFFAVFTQMDNFIYSLLAFPRNSSYDIQATNIPARMSVYEGTIIAGKILQGSISTCHLTDIYYHKGNSLLNLSRSQRYIRLEKLIKDKEIMDSDCLKFFLADIARPNKTELIKLHARTTERTDFTKWIFYPDDWPLKKRHVYSYMLQVGDRLNNPQTLHIMKMSKTKTPDIYNLTDTTTGVTDIASVKQSEKSHQYRSWFETHKERTVKCLHDARDNSWQPIAIIEDDVD